MKEKFITKRSFVYNKQIFHNILMKIFFYLLMNKEKNIKDDGGLTSFTCRVIETKTGSFISLERQSVSYRDEFES